MARCAAVVFTGWTGVGAAAAAGGGFVENLGQWDPRARYRVTLAGARAGTGGMDLWLAADGYVYVLHEPAEAAAIPPLTAPGERAPAAAPAAGEAPVIRAHAVALRWVGGRPARYEATGPLPGVYNWLVGGPDRVVRGARAYETVVAHDVYPGIDVRFDLLDDGAGVETTYVVAAGADPRTITLAAQGADRIAVDGSGELVIATSSGTIRESRPAAFQIDERGRRTLVPASFAIVDGRLRFVLSDYDPERPLVIDPRVSCSRRFGGSYSDYVTVMREDATGRYLAGSSLSAAFPAATGALEASSAGSWDWWVAKFNLANDTLLWATTLGGSSGDYGVDMEVLAGGGVVLLGTSDGTGAFGGSTPITPANAKAGSGYRAVIAEVSSTGAALVKVARFGSSGNTFAAGLARNAATGDTYVLGQSSASCATAGGCGLGPSGGLQPVTSVAPDGFITRLTSDFATATAFTFLGGNGNDGFGDAVVDAAGNVYAVGFTRSSSFPVTVASIGPRGGYDFMAAKLPADLSTASYVTAIGGSGDDAVAGSTYTEFLFGPQSWRPLAVDGGGHAWLIGASSSTDYPVAGTPFQPANRANYDVVVSRLSADGGALDASTYVGGSSTDIGRSIAIDSAGNVVIAASAASVDFPVTVGAVQPACAGNYDMALAVLAPDLSRLLYGSFWGGGSTDWGVGLALGPDPGQVRIAGHAYTSTPTFPQIPRGGGVFGEGGSYDGGVMSLDASGADLAVTKTGTFTRPARWTIAVTNLGVGSVQFASGDRMLLDNLPPAIYGTPTVQNAVNVTGSGDIACAIVGYDLTCTAGGAAVTLVGNASFEVAVPFDVSGSGTLANPRAGGACVVDPDGVITTDTNSENNTADPVQGVVESIAAPFLGGWGLGGFAVLLSVCAVLFLVRREAMTR